MPKRRGSNVQATSPEESPPSSDAIQLSGYALQCAQIFGNGDAQKGASLILRTFAAAWLSLTTDEGSDEPPKGGPNEPICEQGCLSHTADDIMFAWAFGVTMHINVMQLCESFASILVDGFAKSITPEDCVEVVNSLTAAAIGRSVEFGDVLAAKSFRLIVDSFRDLIKAGIATVEKRSCSLAGETYTVERRAAVSAIVDELFAQRYPPPPLVEFSGMRGGTTESSMLPPPTDEQRTAYGPLVKLLTPLWRRVCAYRHDYPDSWTIDIMELPETKKLNAAEVGAMRAVIAEMPYGRHTLKVSGAPIRPVTCAREHARLILGISPRQDKRLLEIARPLAAGGST